MPLALPFYGEVAPAEKAAGSVRAGLVVNRSNAAVRLYWLDFPGSWRLYHTVAPGSRIQQDLLGAVTVSPTARGRLSPARRSL